MLLACILCYREGKGCAGLRRKDITRRCCNENSPPLALSPALLLG